MFRTTPDNLRSHLRDDLNVEQDALVWLHSGLKGLGLVKGGAETVTNAFSNALSQGALVIPTFSYSWNKGEIYLPESTECPDMGGYAKLAWKDPRFKRSLNPNFSVAVMDNTINKCVEDSLISKSTSRSCFGNGSVFSEIQQLTSSGIPAYIMLLGGAHDDVVFRSTFLHMIEERVGVPYRYVKGFPDPEGKGEEVYQYVRFLSEVEFFTQNKVRPPTHYDFPIEEKYHLMGEDMKADGLIRYSKFGYSQTRLVPIFPFLSWLESKLRQDTEYLLK